MARIRLSKQLQSFLGMLLIVIGLAGAQPFLWGWVRTLAQGLYSERTQDQQVTEVRERVVDLEHSIERNRALVEQLAVVAPSVSDTPQLIERVERLAEASGISVTVRSIQQEAALGGSEERVPSPPAGQSQPDSSDVRLSLVPLVITLELIAPPVDLLQFIDSVEHLQELVTVRSWQMEPGGVLGTLEGTGGVRPYTMNVRVVFYLQRGL